MAEPDGGIPIPHRSGWRPAMPLVGLLNVPLAFAFLAFAIVTGLWNSVADNRAEGEAKRLRNVVASSERMLSTMKDLETGMRGYVLTGRPEYLEPYDAALGRIGPELASIAALGPSTENDAMAALAPVRALVSDETTFSNRAVITRRDQGFDPAMAIVVSGEGKRLMDALRATVSTAEERAAAEKSSREDANHRRFVILTFASVASAATTIVLLLRFALARRRESQRSGGMLEGVLGNAPVGLGFLARDLTVQHMNRSLLQMSDWGLGAKLGHTLWAAHPELQARLQVLLEGARDRGQVSSDVDVQVPSGDTPGGLRHFRMGFYPLRQSASADTHEGVGIAVSDLTAATLAEERVRASEAALRTVLDTLPVGVLIAEAPSGRIIDHNLRVETILGHGVMPARPGDGAARWIGFREDGQPVASSEWPLIKVVRSGEAQAELEVDYQRGDGSRSWIGFSGAPMIDHAGRVVGGVVVVADIDARKRSEQGLNAAKQAAEEANLAKSNFLANMSHELRTPLSAIIGYSEMMAEEISDGCQAQDLAADVNKVAGNARHLLGLINDVLDLSKVESGKMDVYAETFAIEPMVRDLATTVHSLISKKGNHLDLQLTPDLGDLNSDLTKVKQVLLNLLSNAAKFTEAGTITLAVSRETQPQGDRVKFRVSDSGIGMTEDQLAKLFQRFQQADASTTRRFGGTGLGLSLTKAFADLLGGAVTVESVPGQGSSFTLDLPSTFTTPADMEPDHALDAPGADGDLVLVIDDDADQRALMTRFLAREGFRSRTAADGETGLTMARNLKPRAILLDVMMPGVDGWSVLSALKEDKDLADIPVVMVTFVEQRALAASLGAADYVLKPVRWDRFKAVMDRFRPPANDVLIVDDDADTRARIRASLERDGWSVVEAENGLDALSRLETHTPGMVLLDLTMPVMDGFAFLERMRERPECADIPVIVLTALDLSREDRRRLKGASQILNKGDISLRSLADRLHGFAGIGRAA